MKKFLVAILLAVAIFAMTACAGLDCNGIKSIEKTSTNGLVDTYTITYTDGETTTFTVTNGQNGINGINGTKGDDGHTPVITIQNGNWYIDGVDTEILAEGVNGKQGAGILHVEFNQKGQLLITLTDGTVLDPVDPPEKHEHSFTDWDLLKQPGHTEKGVEFRFCIECNYTESRYVDALNHEIVVQKRIEPTCTAKGLSEGCYCLDCDYKVEQNEIPQLSHKYSKGKCLNCNDSVLGSAWINPDFAVGDYSIVVIPDTQNMVTYHSELYFDMMKWIVDNEKTYNIKAAMHMGDMVNNNTAAEWDINKHGMDILNQSDIAWMPMRGNHDDSAWFNEYYDYETYGANRSWFGGAYQEGKLDHYYWCFSAESRDYLILSLGWAPDWNVLDWACEIIEENSDKNVIINCHAYMNSDGTLLSSGDAHCVSSYHPGYPNGDDIWNKFKQYSNVVLALGGHISSPDIVKFVDVNGGNQDVYSLLVDNQNEDVAKGLGMILMLTFNDENNVVNLNWYSTKYDALYGQKNQYAITLSHVTDDFVSVKEDITDLFNTWTNGGPVIHHNGYGYDEKPNLGSNYNLKYSDFVKIDDYDMLELTICGRSGYSATGGFAFYQEANAESFISYGNASRNGNGMTLDKTVVRTVAVPENAKYIRVSYWSEQSINSSYPFSCTGYKTVEKAEHS